MTLVPTSCVHVLNVRVRAFLAGRVFNFFIGGSGNQTKATELLLCCTIMLENDDSVEGAYSFEKAKTG